MENGVLFFSFLLFGLRVGNGHILASEGDEELVFSDQGPGSELEGGLVSQKVGS
jgi:hypothetical protein